MKSHRAIAVFVFIAAAPVAASGLPPAATPTRGLPPAATYNRGLPPAATTTTKKPVTAQPTLTDAQVRTAIAELRTKHLLMPIQGTDPERLKGSFYEMRGNEMHGAADILAPRYTPILAVEDGVLAKLWLSKAGGNTIYEFDPSGKYVYYYAHLDRYAPNLQEGQKFHRGQVIGYVGTSGNAPPNTPHLHFSISVLTVPGKWWTGSSIDPYEVFKGTAITAGPLPPVPPQPGAPPSILPQPMPVVPKTSPQPAPPERLLPTVPPSHGTLPPNTILKGI